MDWIAGGILELHLSLQFPTKKNKQQASLSNFLITTGVKTRTGRRATKFLSKKIGVSSIHAGVFHQGPAKNIETAKKCKPHVVLRSDENLVAGPQDVSTADY